MMAIKFPVEEMNWNSAVLWVCEADLYGCECVILPSGEQWECVKNVRLINETRYRSASIPVRIPLSFSVVFKDGKDINFSSNHERMTCSAAQIIILVL